MVKKIAVKYKLGDPAAVKSDLEYWLSLDPLERVSAVEILRRQRPGNSKRLQRVVRVIKQA
jgi:hypothetical protein